MSKEDSEENKECPLELPGWINFLQQYASEQTMIKLHLIGAIMVAFSVFMVAISVLVVLFVAQQSLGHFFAMAIALIIILIGVFLLFNFFYEKNLETLIKNKLTYCLIEEILKNELDKNIVRTIWFNRKNFYDDMHRIKLKKPDSPQTTDLIKCYAKEFIEKYKDL